jgi:hypothetical protein
MGFSQRATAFGSRGTFHEGKLRAWLTWRTRRHHADDAGRRLHESRRRALGSPFSP